MRISILPMFPQIAFWIASLVVVNFLTKRSCMKVTMVMDQTSPDSEPVPADLAVHEQSPDVIWKKAPKTFEYSRDMPILFIGGMPHSGTTLLRSIMDAHPMMRCGEETRLLQRILSMRADWYRSEKEKKRLEEAGVGEIVVDAAISEFILEVIVNNGKPAERLCNQDPYILKSAKYLINLFPKARFILLLRDGRAAAHSLISRLVPDNKGMLQFTYRSLLTEWNTKTKELYDLCMKVRATYCLPVHYEDLVLHPRKTLQGILDFADMPWHDFVMEHEKHMENITYFPYARSTDQIVKPIYTDSLKSWVGKIPDDVLNHMPFIAPMLSTLGYDPRSHDPFYGKPDTEVVEKYEHWVQLHPDEAVHEA